MQNKTIMVLAIVSVLIGGTILSAYAQVRGDVEIDIKPGSDPNSINPNSNGVIPMLLVGTDDLEVTDELFIWVLYKF